jgi:hypothetical protein
MNDADKLSQDAALSPQRRLSATTSGDSEQKFMKGGSFGELLRESSERAHKSETLLLNSWQPDDRKDGKPRSCHMQTITLEAGGRKADVKVYWNKRSPPGLFNHAPPFYFMSYYIISTQVQALNLSTIS